MEGNKDMEKCCFTLIFDNHFISQFKRNKQNKNQAEREKIKKQTNKQKTYQNHPELFKTNKGKQIFVYFLVCPLISIDNHYRHL